MERQLIERAFGMLVMRCGMFSREFLFASERWSTDIMVCMKLHDLSLERKVKFTSIDLLRILNQEIFSYSFR